MRMTRMIPACCVALLALARAPDANACSGPNPDGHTYAEIVKANAGAATNGAEVLINTNSLTADNTWHFAFVNHEMWYGVDSTGSYWVEVGFKTGSTCRSAPSAAGGCTGETPVNNAIFWADQRASGGGYHEHYPNVSWKYDAWYEAAVTYAGKSCAWNVYVGGVYLGQSTGNCASGNRWLAAGLESTNYDSGQHVGGSLADWKELTVYGVWVNGWEDPGLYFNCPADIIWNGDWATEEQLHGPI